MLLPNHGIVAATATVTDPLFHLSAPTTISNTFLATSSISISISNNIPALALAFAPTLATATATAMTSSSSSPSPAVVAVAATSAAVGLVAGYCYRSMTTITTTSSSSSSSCSKSDEQQVPKSLLESGYGKELALAVALAREAGSNMVEYLEAKGTAEESSLDLGIETKSGVADICTRVDVENERLVIDGIRAAFPDHQIIGEESVGTGSLPPLDPNVPTWIIDPIDGTTNFSSGLHSLTCVSIGFCIGGRPVVGVVYAPGTNELYIGVKGRGAYRNGRKLWQDPERSTKCIHGSVVCNEMGYTRDPDHLAILTGAQTRVMLRGCKAMRQIGSGCLDLCFVANGKLDVVYAGLCTEGWKPWDYAASLVICKEAGCTMESIEAQAVHGCDGFDLYSTSILCGVSKPLVDEMRSVLLSSSSSSSSKQ